jgi:hypothetical protein
MILPTPIFVPPPPTQPPLFCSPWQKSRRLFDFDPRICSPNLGFLRNNGTFKQQVRITYVFWLHKICSCYKT